MCSCPSRDRAGLTEERSLLVPGDTRDQHSVAVQCLDLVMPSSPALAQLRQRALGNPE